MYNPFPEILFLGPYFAPVILRAAAAIAFFLVAERLYKMRAELQTTRFPVIGTAGTVLPWIWIALLGSGALAFAVGFSIQIVAILGAATAMKMWFFRSRYPNLFTWSGIAYFLLTLICLALLITGAGAFAIDSPL